MTGDKLNKLVLSIVIPCYNVQQYIEKCLDSIYCQNLDENLFEVICVDDGSTDNSLKILNEYSCNHSNLIIHNTSNKGASAARNLGLEKSNGKYIWFVDGDDEIIDHSLETILPFLYNNINILSISFVKGKECSFAGEEQVHFSQSKLFDCHIWSNILKSDVLRKNKLRFDETLKYGEDTLFMWHYFSLIPDNSFLKILNPMYFYRDTCGSVMSSAGLKENVNVRVNNLLYTVIKLKNILVNVSDKKKRKLFKEKIRIETECLLYLLPSSDVNYNDTLDSLRENKLYPYKFMINIFKSKKRGYSYKNAISFLFFPIALYYNLYYFLRKRKSEK